MPVYRVLLGDVVNGKLLAELPATSATYSHVLNGPGDAEISIGLVQPPDLAKVLRETLVPPAGAVTAANAAGPGRVTVALERDGVLVWGGLVWQLAPEFGAGTATLKAKGWHSYFRRRIIDEDLVYSQVDQATIAADLIDYAQDSFWDTVRVDTSQVQTTGRLRDREYKGLEYKQIGEAIEQLASVKDGFDFRYITVRDAEGLHARFLVDYPATGRETGITLALGNQLSKASTVVDATQLATVAYAVGEGKLRAVWHLPHLRGVYPRLDAVTTHTDVSIKDTLDSHALRRLARGAAPLVIPNIEISARLQPTLGSYRVGDLVTAAAEKGWYGFSDTYRLTKIGTSVSTDAGETVKVDLAQEEVFHDR